ncbi:MAG: sugar ABC transporter permease [Spirochaetes bacterium]|nr:MAG: sugar ABC transporter permease [Spirochaetota bacterium]
MRRYSGMAAREARLALWMLIPAFLIVFAIILFPVFTNFWISFKSVKLGELRPPSPVVREQVVKQPEQPGDELIIRYRARNTSQNVALENVVMTIIVPEGLKPVDVGYDCSFRGSRLVCNFGRWKGGFNKTLEMRFEAEQSYFSENSGKGKVLGFTIDASAPNVLTNLKFTLKNYGFVLSGREFWPTLGATVVYTFGGTIGSIILGLFAAQLLNAKFLGKGILRGLFLFPYVAPVIAVAFTWSFFLDPFSGTVNALLKQFGLMERSISFLSERSFNIDLFGLEINLPLALSTVIAFESWRYFPFAFLFILARLQAIPSQLYESAEVDGAGAFRKFWNITIPQLMTVLTTLFLLRFMWTFNKFDDVFLLTGGAAGTKTLPISVYDNAFGRADIGAGAATAVLLFLFLAVFLILYFHYSPEEQ